ncbi:O-methyltransferase [Psychroflexus gondwanensis ACAM 44]|jgi:predicted O-methyltransferase YrrM|uniref:O-methyltransferase n=1 Tax=Psychroflexus gondwanensis ACAM 44 TaxID=1189619 RepID=N1WPB5_9FLAO|nr:O-methyltransferase [Psychroflexus gondwanensis]EMY82136.1 O-methyltransferase [Psychroflexus gondwanensis ACAM 44]
MDFISSKLQAYAESHTEMEPELLQQLTKETWQKVLQPRMLSGHFQGRLLSLISKLVQPTSILEIGTYTGYSALSLAEGLSKEGKLHTIDRNEEVYDLQRKYFDLSGFGPQIIQYTGDARRIIPEIDIQFDLVFMDADKKSYPKYFELIIDKLKPGGLLLSDNVLWSGKIVETLHPKDEDTKALLAYNTLLRDDPRIETVLLPIRDGLTLSRKR